ncbi:hypothetical protein ACLOJK_001460 [Asimina triloba]
MLSPRRVCSFFFLCLLLLLGSCEAVRRLPEEQPALGRLAAPMGLRYQAQMLNFLPRGVPLPPSGPSPRINAQVDSVSPP